MSRGVWTRKLPIVERRLQIASPVLLGVVADTHMSAPAKGRSLHAVVELFRRVKVDLVLHAGDAGHASILQGLQDVARTVAVRGNADPVDLIEMLPDRVWIEIGSRILLLMHGHHGKTALKAARAAASPGIDLIVFGHSHRPLIDREGSTILFNPGSPTERRWNPHFGVGLVRISDAEVEPELVLFDDIRHLANVARPGD